MDIQKIALVLAPAMAVIALLYGFVLILKILKLKEGNEKMKEVSDAIRKGSTAYLNSQFKVILPFLLVISGLIFWKFGMGTMLTFILGGLLSGLSGYIGMWIAVQANVRTTNSALKGLAPAMKTAFSAGIVNGMLVVGLSLLGISIIYIVSLITHTKPTDVLIGYGFGAALIALFMRVGGGVFTKAADVGADLVGKVEKGIPEDDPRNPATIADNVGDNVGDCAGMGADVFESYSITIIAAMILGGVVFGWKGVLFPLIIRGAEIFASILGTFFVKIKSKKEDPMKALNRGFMVSAVTALVLFLGISYFVIGDIKIGFALITGLLSMVAILFLTQYYTGLNSGPIKAIVEASRTGSGTTLITGLAYGMESVMPVVLVIAMTIGFGYYFAGFFGIALAGMGMLSLTGIIMAMDTFGPIADNADGIGEMSGIEGSARTVMASLDAVGNTTKALTKGFAIGSAAVASASLFATYFEKTGLTVINIGSPFVFVGVLIGAMLPFFFSSRLMMAVGRAAGLMVEEVRRQFREIKGIMEGKAKPDYAKCVSISTQAAQKELIIPAGIVILSPILISVLGKEALGGFLGGIIFSAVCLALFSCNSGAAWDNAKKYVEVYKIDGGKGSDVHKAAVVGDTVGDPLKDTSGPALNPMVKIINIVALLIV
jgi:K(+)-stimulated pyrophosphate-energized sodium pump